jgi:hypothetical protein
MPIQEEKNKFDNPQKWFGMGIPEGTTIQAFEYTDGSIQLVFITAREGKKPISTSMRVGPKTFHLLSCVIFSAAHNADIWKPFVTDETVPV